MRETQQHLTSRRAGELVLGRFAQDGRAIGVRENKTGVLRHDFGRHAFRDSEIKPVAMRPVFAPFAVNAEIGDGRFDFHDQNRPVV